MQMLIIGTESVDVDSAVHLSSGDIQRTFIKSKTWMGGFYRRLCRVFTLPFRFKYFKDITNNFPHMIFNTVTHLMIHVKVAFKHEFFIRLEYSHEISLDITSVNVHYMEHFLNETKTHLPRLTQLKGRI
ncbi:unnamed protein product [Rotaria magnacalcarata]|uniref:Uncharacterized protein n=2 Tax=Rotaria magnacalcarata TaxID=392030 RepID=A0A816Q6X1_9BILA|nr:unnamed protein product [Rotaria magnacalcarata]CAF2056900.1 unnamed protein product [Rotaria magnacalcarata]